MNEAITVYFKSICTEISKVRYYKTAQTGWVCRTSENQYQQARNAHWRYSSTCSDLHSRWK